MVADFRKGTSIQQMVERRRQRQANAGRKRAPADKVATASELIAADKSSKQNSVLKMAKVLRVIKSAARNILKGNLKLKPFKRVRATKNAEKTLRKRAAIASQIVEMFDGGMEIDKIFFSDETWVDQDCDGALNAQNERMWFPKSTKKDDVLPELEKARQQRAPGLMVRLTCSPHNGGTLLKPHIVPHGQMMDGPYYANMLESDVLRQIEVAVEGRDFYFQQDLASVRACKVTKALLEKEEVRLVPWFPAGADVTPLDVFVNHAVKEYIRGKDVSTLSKLKLETGIAIAKLAADATFRAQLQKSCRSFEKRVRWIAANGGRKVSRKGANKDWFAWYEHFAPEGFGKEEKISDEPSASSAAQEGEAV